MSLQPSEDDVFHTSAPVALEDEEQGGSPKTSEAYEGHSELRSEADGEQQQQVEDEEEYAPTEHDEDRPKEVRLVTRGVTLVCQNVECGVRLVTQVCKYSIYGPGG
jgi:hypothetical protein